MPRVPRRYRPLQRTSIAQAALQYRPQLDLLAMLMGETRHDLKTSVRQARGGGRILEAGLERSRAQLPQNFETAGLDTGSLPQGPDANRIRETLAGALNELSLREAQAQEGAASGVRQARDRYTQDVGKIRQQVQSVVGQQSALASSLFGEGVQTNRATRAAARAEAQKQSFQAGQNALDRGSRTETALIGQGIAPDGSIIPGGKADPKAKPPRKPTGADRTAAAQLGKAKSWINRIDSQGYQQKNPDARKRRSAIGEILTAGSKQDGIPALPDYIVSAALDLRFNNGVLSVATVRKLRKLGIQVKRLPGVRLPSRNKTEQGIRAGDLAGPPAPR